MLRTVAKSTDNDLRCSENVAYDTVGGKIKMSTQDNMTCSENIAYTIAQQVNKNDLTASPASSKPVYDEVSLKK